MVWYHCLKFVVFKKKKSVIQKGRLSVCGKMHAVGSRCPLRRPVSQSPLTAVLLSPHVSTHGIYVPHTGPACHIWTLLG
jgi:hypothetical protein